MVKLTKIFGLFNLIKQHPININLQEQNSKMQNIIYFKLCYKQIIMISIQKTIAIIF